MSSMGFWLPVRRWAVAFVCANLAFSGAAAAEKVKITYSSWGTNEEIQRFRDLAAVFNQRHNDIEVEILHITGDYNAKLLTQLAAGVGPDTFHLPDSGPPQMARKGMLENLLPYLQKDRQLRLEHFYPPLLTLAQYKGGLYGLPPDENPIVLYFNGDMFAHAGLASPVELDKKGEWTWETFRQAGKKLTRRSAATGRNEAYGFFLPNWWGPVLPFIWGGGGDLFAEEGTASRLTDPKSLTGLSFLAAMMHEDRSTSHIMPADPNGMFREGRLAMIPQGRWMVPTYRTLLTDVSWDVVPMPTGPAGRVTAIAGAFSGMNAQSKHKAAAWEWLRFFLGLEGQQFRLGRNGNAVPSIRGLEETVAGSGQMPANAGAFLDGLAYGRPLPVEMGLYPEMPGVIFSGFNPIWDGSKSPRAALEEIRPKVDALLQQSPER